MHAQVYDPLSKPKKQKQNKTKNQKQNKNKRTKKQTWIIN